jgi:hypothetical protein
MQVVNDKLAAALHLAVVEVHNLTQKFEQFGTAFLQSIVEKASMVKKNVRRNEAGHFVFVGLLDPRPHHLGYVGPPLPDPLPWLVENRV